MWMSRFLPLSFLCRRCLWRETGASVLSMTYRERVVRTKRCYLRGRLALLRSH